MTKGDRNALYLLSDDPFIIINQTDKETLVVVWDRNYYLKEAKNQLIDKYVY